MSEVPLYSDDDSMSSFVGEWRMLQQNLIPESIQLQYLRPEGIGAFPAEIRPMALITYGRSVLTLKRSEFE